jgi:hypothetical protein
MAHSRQNLACGGFSSGTGDTACRGLPANQVVRASSGSTVSAGRALGQGRTPSRGRDTPSVTDSFPATGDRRGPGGGWAVLRRAEPLRATFPHGGRRSRGRQLPQAEAVGRSGVAGPRCVDSRRRGAVRARRLEPGGAGSPGRGARNRGAGPSAVLAYRSVANCQYSFTIASSTAVKAATGELSPERPTPAVCSCRS